MADVDVSMTQTPRDGNRVFVGNLAWKVQWQTLKDHMRKLGGNVVRADIFQDAQGRSKGCGIVEYSTAEEAKEAIRELTDTELFDRKIFVREDREETRLNSENSFHYNQRRNGHMGSKKKFDEGKDTQIFVSNLPYKTTWHELKDIFNEDGAVIRADIHEQNGRSKGYGTLVFKTAEAATKAIEKFNESQYKGRKIYVRLNDATLSSKYKSAS